MDSVLPKTKSTWLQVRIHKGEKALTFLYRFENLPADASSWPVWRINPTQFRDGSSGGVDEGGGVSVVDHYGKIVPNCKMDFELRGVSDQTADVRVGVGMGAWKTVITQKANVIGKRSFSQDGQQWTVMFYKPTAGASGTQRKSGSSIPCVTTD
jgi:hypothetical protein